MHHMTGHYMSVLYCIPMLLLAVQAGLLLLVHGEVTDPAVDFYDRERVFIDTKLRPLLDKLPELRVVLEHITTRDAAELVAAGPPTLAATVTPQHMLLNRNALFQVGAQALRHSDHIIFPLKRHTGQACRGAEQSFLATQPFAASQLSRPSALPEA